MFEKKSHNNDEISEYDISEYDIPFNALLLNTLEIENDEAGIELMSINEHAEVEHMSEEFASGGGIEALHRSEGISHEQFEHMLEEFKDIKHQNNFISDWMCTKYTTMNEIVKYRLPDAVDISMCINSQLYNNDSDSILTIGEFTTWIDIWKWADSNIKSNLNVPEDFDSVLYDSEAVEYYRSGSRYSKVFLSSFEKHPLLSNYYILVCYSLSVINE